MGTKLSIYKSTTAPLHGIHYLKICTKALHTDTSMTSEQICTRIMVLPCWDTQHKKMCDICNVNKKKVEICGCKQQASVCLDGDSGQFCEFLVIITGFIDSWCLDADQGF